MGAKCVFSQEYCVTISTRENVYIGFLTQKKFKPCVQTEVVPDISSAAGRNFVNGMPSEENIHIRSWDREKGIQSDVNCAANGGQNRKASGSNAYRSTDIFTQMLKGKSFCRCCCRNRGKRPGKVKTISPQLGMVTSPCPVERNFFRRRCPRAPPPDPAGGYDLSFSVQEYWRRMRSSIYAFQMSSR